MIDGVLLLTPQEVADYLRTTRTAVYTMHERQQLPGAVKIGRRLLFRPSALVDWPGQNRPLSPKGVRR